jgi:hypothetical protein
MSDTDTDTSNNVRHPLPDSIEKELLSILIDPKLKVLPFKRLCDNDRFGEYLRRVQKRRAYLIRNQTALDRAVSKFFPTHASSSSQVLSSPTPSSLRSPISTPTSQARPCQETSSEARPRQPRPTKMSADDYDSKETIYTLLDDSNSSNPKGAEFAIYPQVMVGKTMVDQGIFMIFGADIQDLKNHKHSFKLNSSGTGILHTEPRKPGCVTGDPENLVSLLVGGKVKKKNRLLKSYKAFTTRNTWEKNPATRTTLYEFGDNITPSVFSSGRNTSSS